MENIETKLREEAQRLLLEKKADVIIGYEKGTLPLTATPCFITRPEEAEKLIWNNLCTQNLAKFVHDLITAHKNSQKRVKPEDRKKKVIGVVARGCTTRSIIIHLQERQYDRGEVYIIGVPCDGYVESKKLRTAAGGADIIEGDMEGGQIKVKTAEGEKTVALKEVLSDSCRTCRYNNPIISDVMVGSPAPAMNPEAEYDQVKEFEAKSIEERWAYFTKEMAKCIRCNACRQACPSCYCPTCFAEQSMPQWVGIGEDATDTQVFQFMRLYHMVGRCVDCGSCVAVCPMGVDLRKFLKKIDKDCWEMFGNRAGSSMEDMPPLGKFSENDKEDFIYNP
ncbi:MAG TPA: 4Fe-4S dicluster domain-containing protein [Smithellaceae bacterium]|nr:4Fe-4S dicluster domain-containing protein [Smithellaceae bacterium]HRS89080.1 4Fe-4S dicluster domain-containing protein [Smithellaceae bacterium]HRV25048.1 4Fe-4S dicluster domain-containing protein [Smithellaceae bacterium]